MTDNQATILTMGLGFIAIAIFFHGCATLAHGAEPILLRCDGDDCSVKRDDELIEAPAVPTPSFESAVVEKGNCWTHPKDGTERCGWEIRCVTPISWRLDGATLTKVYGVPQCVRTP